MDPVAAHMQRTYQVFYFPNDYRNYLVTRRQPYMDVRHIVRTKMGQLHQAGPTAVARAEGALCKGHGPTYGAIIHSRTVFNNTLKDYQPLLVKRMNRLIRATMT